jgi:hypothetical protein
MTAGDGDGVDQLLAQLFGQLLQIGFRKFPQIGRDVHLIE